MFRSVKQRNVLDRLRKEAQRILSQHYRGTHPDLPGEGFIITAEERETLLDLLREYDGLLD